MRRFVPLGLCFWALCLFGDAAARGQVAAKQAPSRSLAIAGHVAEASQRFGMPESWIYAVIRTESSGRTGAVSNAGAMGLMQLMPATWSRQRDRFGLGSNPFDPHDNIMAGTSYLRELYDRYGSSGFFAAYNAGPGRYENWRDRGRPLPPEALSYVAKIARTLQLASTAPAIAGTLPMRLSCAPSQLFAARVHSSDRANVRYIAGPPPQPVRASDISIGGLFAPILGSSLE